MQTDKNNIIENYVDCDDVENITYLDISKYDPSKPTILFIDDFNSVITLFSRLVKRMRLNDNFNIIYSSGIDAVLRVLKTMYCVKTVDINIDIVISDITFGGSVLVKGRPYNFNGIEFVGILKEINPNIIFKFITGHDIDKDKRPIYYTQYSKYADDNLIDHVEYKDKPITTNKELILDLVKGTEYEELAHQ